MDQEILDEQLNVRLFRMRLVRRLWIAAALALVGALAGLLLYLVVTGITRPVLYEARCDVYLHFVDNESTNQVLDHYNAYTWNNLIATDSFMAHLADDEVRTALAEGRVSVTAELPSDIRVLWMCASSPDAQLAEKSALAMSHALQAYALENEVVREAEIISGPHTALRAYPQRGGVAAAAGGVLGLLAGLFFLWLTELADEAVYVPEDAAQRYRLPVYVILPELFPGENASHMETLAGERESVRLRITSDPADVQAGEICEELGGLIPDYLQGRLTFVTEGEADESLIVIRYGAKNAAMYRHLIAESALSGAPAKGIVFAGADASFLKRYYRR